MQSTFDNTQADTRNRQPYMLPVVAGGLVLLFLAAPWSWEHKAHAALHGLCAQTPSHTLLLGGTPLPFDARMTGIYGGFIISLVYLVARGRHRAARLPGYPVMAVLAVLVGVMAIDGFNSLFRDLGIRHFYMPDNRVRLITGMGTGITLAAVLCYLSGVTFWRQPNVHARVVRWMDLMVIPIVLLPFSLLTLSGWNWLIFPVSFMLLVAALSVISLLALISMVLVRRLDYTFANIAELQSHAAIALIVAAVVMGLLSSGRFLLEHLTGMRPLT